MKLEFSGFRQGRNLRRSDIPTEFRQVRKKKVIIFIFSYLDPQFFMTFFDIIMYEELNETDYSSIEEKFNELWHLKAEKC